MRSAGGLRPGVSRVYSKKPVTLPMRGLLLQGGAGDHLRMSLFGLARLIFRDAENSLVLVREHLDELWQHLAPVFENPLAARTAGSFDVPGDQVLQRLHVDR